MSITRALRLSLALVALSLVASAASAQEWPSNQPYKCRWSRVISGVTHYGEAVVTFQNMVHYGLYQTGTLRTDYPNGTFLAQNITLYWDWNNSTYFKLQVTGGPMCTVTTYSNSDDPSHRAIRFDGSQLAPWEKGPGDSCSNGTFQVCAR